MNSAGVITSVGLQEELIACPQCGSTSRVGRGLCLKCLLYRGLGDETYDSETLENVLDAVDVRDADWRLGNYQILDEIGRGGMGVIYRARQRHSRRIVALKRILPHHADSHDTLIRFRREAEAAASLDHPNILPIYEVSEGEDGFPFFSMKFASGGSLLESKAALQTDTRQAIALMAKVSRGVAYAHSQSILHRDLKPGNILLDGRGEPMVSDFGLAKWLDASSDLTRTLTIFGTPGYIAPEQASGPASGLKATADVYSLGAILFDLIAGRPPFLGEHALSVIKQAEEKRAPKLRSLVSKVDRDLETICARCLEREPTLRYPSAGDLAEDLERWLDGRPVVARPVSFPVRIWRWGRRNPKLAASVAGSILGGLGVLILVTLAFLPGTSRFGPSPVIFEKSIAVLPFENLSDNKENAYFADGVQDEIISDLSKVADLKVISRTSALQYRSDTKRNLKQIAAELGVAHIVEGTVQRVGERVKISAQLIDARTDTHLWSATLDRSLADVFAVQSEVAFNIVSQLKAKLSSAEEMAIKEKPTSDLVAYDRFARAKVLIESTVLSGRFKDSLFEAAQLLDQATARDPTFLRAYCQLARVHDKIYILGLDHTPERVAMGDAAIRKAAAIDRNSGEVHLARANHLYCAYLDYDAARREIAIAASLLPNEPKCFELGAFLERRGGNWEEAVRQLSKALELDPRNVYLLQQLALTYEHMRRFPEMAATLDRAIAIVPDDVSTRLTRSIVDLEWRADSKPMHATIQQALAKDPAIASEIAEDSVYLAVCERDWAAAERALAASNTACRIENIFFPPGSCEGFLAHLRGDTIAARTALLPARAEAERIVREQPAFGEAFCALGMIEAALGDTDKAIEHGEQAVQLVPVSKDAINGPLLMQYLSVIYSWGGQNDRAIEELKRAAAIPSTINYGVLRLHPYWDELRGDPRFEKIVASLAPK